MCSVFRATFIAPAIALGCVTMVTARFDVFPDEILSDIILQLPLVDILRCCRVCMRLHLLIQNSAVIQYTIELAAHGLVACPGSTLSAAASIRMLREQQDAWRRCEWKEERMIRLRAGCRTYEFRNGVWAFGRRPDAVSAPGPPFPAVLQDSSTTLTCFNLMAAIACKDSDADKFQWTLGDLGLAIRDFTMDPLIDLLAIVEETHDSTTERVPFRVQLRKLSDGKPHEMAAKHSLEIGMSVSNPESCAFSIQLQGPYVGVLVQQDGSADDYDTLAVWNWRTGVLVFKMDATTCSFDDFAFVNECTLLLAVLGQPVMLQVWRFDTARVFFLGGFALPATAAGFAYLQMQFDGGPSSSLAGAKTLDGTPYALSPVPQVLAISLRVICTDIGMQDADVDAFTMVMRPGLMFEILNARYNGPVELSQGAQCLPHACIAGRALEWKEWGPQCTRWLPEDPGHMKWEPCLVGGRFATVIPARPDTGELMYLFLSPPQVIRVYDFRPEIVLRYAQSFPQDVCTEASVVYQGEVFEEDIHSTLPYHVAISKELPHNMSGVMIDEGRLICTKADPDEEWRKLYVYSF